MCKYVVSSVTGSSCLVLVGKQPQRHLLIVSGASRVSLTTTCWEVACTWHFIGLCHKLTSVGLGLRPSKLNFPGQFSISSDDVHCDWGYQQLISVTALLTSYS